MTATADRTGARVATGGYLTRRSYTDPAVGELEMAHVLPDSWVFVCDISELADPGDFVALAVGHEPVVVVRAEDGIRGYGNVCPHRASVLLAGSGNCGRRIRCPYHGWCFDLAGRLTSVPHRPRLDRNPIGLGLTPVAIATWGRLVLVNPSSAAPPLLECLEDLPEVFASAWESTELVHRSRERHDVNWKLWADIGFDSYHLPAVHQSTIGRGVDLRAVRMVAGSLHTAYGVMGEGTQRSVFAYLYPGLHVSTGPDGTLLVVADLPDGSGGIATDMAVYARPGAAPGFSLAEMADGTLGELYRTVRQEDLDQCGRLEAGLRSRMPVPGPVSELSLPEARFHDWLRYMYHRHAVAARALGVPENLVDP